MDTAKSVLERLYDIMYKPQNGINVLSELQELGDQAQAALNEVYDAEQTIEQQNSLLHTYDKGYVA